MHVYAKILLRPTMKEVLLTLAPLSRRKLTVFLPATIGMIWERKFPTRMHDNCCCCCHGVVRKKSAEKSGERSQKKRNQRRDLLLLDGLKSMETFWRKKKNWQQRTRPFFPFQIIFSTPGTGNDWCFLVVATFYCFSIFHLSLLLCARFDCREIAKEVC